MTSSARPFRTLFAIMVTAEFVFPQGAYAASTSSSVSSTSSTANSASLRMAAPEGFEALEAERQAMLDIYYGGEKLGVAQAVIKPGSVKFEDPAELARLVPGIASYSQLAEALSGELPGNVELVCNPSAVSPCPVLSPAKAAIIFDADRFRAELFVNPGLLVVQRSSDPAYLDEPDDQLALVSLFGGTLSGSSSSKNAYRVQNQSTVSLGALRLRSDAALASETGLGFDNLTLEADRGDMRYVGGLFWAPGTEFLGRHRIVGVGARTQLDTRVDREALLSTPLNVFLQRPSRVDLLVDGRVMVSKIYSAGSHLLDTSQLPDGSYEVAINIAEGGSAVQEERRFFTKGSTLAPMGRPLLSASVGLIPSSSDPNGKNTGTPFYETSAAYRLTSRFGIDGFVFGTNQKAFLGGGAVLFSSWAHFRVSGMVSTAKDYGAVFQAASYGHGSLAFSFDLRTVKSRNGGPLLPVSTSHDTFSEDPGVRFGDRGSYSQGVANVGYRVGPANIRLTGLYRRDSSRAATYSIGPSFDMPLVHTNRWNILLQADARKTDKNYSSYVGVRLLTNAGRISFSGAAGVSRQEQASDRGGQRRVIRDAQFAWSQQLGDSTQVATESAFGRDLESSYARTGGYIRSPAGNLRADILHQFGDAASTQYAATVEGGIVVGKGKFSVGGRELNSTATVVRLQGGNEAQRFDVLVDESPRGTVKPGDNLVLFLNPYDTYSVRLRSSGSGMSNFDTAARKVTLYPGNVATLDWDVAPVVVVFGRAIDLRGIPIANADITTSRGKSQTNEEGYFQVETAQHEPITVRDRLGKMCSIPPSKARPIDGYLARGEAECR